MYWGVSLIFEDKEFIGDEGGVVIWLQAEKQKHNNM